MEPNPPVDFPPVDGDALEPGFEPPKYVEPGLELERLLLPDPERYDEPLPHPQIIGNQPPER